MSKTDDRWHPDVVLKMLDGTASSFRWMLASMLAVHGGALVALMQSGIDKRLITAAGWYFVSGLGLSLLAGFASCWAMMLVVSTEGSVGLQTTSMNPKWGRGALLTLCISGGFLITSLLLAFTGMVVLQLAVAR